MSLVRPIRQLRAGRVLPLVLLLGTALAGWAVMMPTNNVSYYHSQSWSYEDGLPHNSVWSAVQTRDGYLWVGTQGGLARFDGVRFTHFNSKSAPGARDSWVYRVYESRDGSLWVSYDTGALLRHRDGVFEDYTQLAGGDNGPVLSFCETREGVLWMGSRKRVIRLQDGKFASFPAGHPLATLAIWSMFEDARGGVWFAGSPGVYYLPPGLPWAEAASLTNTGVLHYMHNICEDRQGRLWMGAVGQLQTVKNGVVRVYNKEDGLAHTYVNDICQDRRGEIWVGTHGGVQRLVGDRFETQHNAFNRSFGVINDLYEDREGNLWICAQEGLSRLKPNRFVTLTQEEGMSHHNIISVLEDRATNLWVATWGGGLNRLRKGQFSAFSMTPGPQGLDILSLCEDRQGTLWVGCEYTYGLYRQVGGQFERVGRDMIKDPAIRVIYEDRSRVLWLGTRGALYRYAEEVFTRFTQADGLAGNVIRALLEDRSGHLWIGTETGLSCRLEDGRFVNYGRGDGLSHERVVAIHEDKQGVLWFGTRGGGIHRLEGERFKACTTRDGLFEDDVLEIIEDDQGWFWMSSPHGVFRVKRTDLEDFCKGRRPDVHCMAFGKTDGMVSSSCVGAAKPAGWKSRDGRLWFPTTKGLVTVQPDKIALNQQPPPVVIEEVYGDKKLLTSDGRRQASLILPPGRGEMEIHYTALSLSASEKNRFRYRLEGLEPEWVEATGRRVAYYNNLQPGRYRFQVKACNNDGFWNDVGAELALVVEPHFWQTWWFQAGVILAAVGAIGGTVRTLTRRRLERRLERLEQMHAVEKERTRIAQDMHDEIGGQLAKLLFLGGLAKRHLASPDEASKHIDKVAHTTREVILSLDEIVWAVNPKNDTLDHLANYLCRYAGDFFQDSPIDCELDLPGDLPHRPVSTDVRHNLFLAVKEALANVLKHSGASQSWLRLAVTSGAIEVEIADNGRGVPADKLAPPPVAAEGRSAGRVGNGLQNMRQRLEAIGGRCRIEPRPGGGTRITFHVPIS